MDRISPRNFVKSLESEPYNQSISVEASFNKFVKEFGGELISEMISRNPSFKNADYFFKKRSIVAELKCLEKDLFRGEDYRTKTRLLYDNWVKRGLAPRLLRTTTIETRNLPVECQLEVANLVKKPVEQRIKEANRQIKETKEHFNAADAEGLLLLVNDGNYSLESDAVMYLVSRCIRTQHRAITTIIYFTVNMPAIMPGVDRDVLIWLDCHRPSEAGLPREFLDSLRDGWLSFLERKTGEKIPRIMADNDSDIQKMKFIRPH